MVDTSFLMQSYDSFGRIEQQFNDALDQSLEPRGPDMLYDLVEELNLAPGSLALDIGCGEGRHAFQLAGRFHLNVRGVDPVPRHIEIANAEAVKTREDADVDVVSFELGYAESLLVESSSVDLIWCRDVLCLVEDLQAAYAEFRRVLKPAGYALVYQTFVGDRIEPREAEALDMGCVLESMRPDNTERAIESAGLHIDRCIVLGSEFGEYGQELTGRGAAKLIRAARLLRDPQRYIQQFGRENYDIALGDNLWHVFRLIGKLSDRVYLLSSPSG